MKPVDARLPRRAFLRGLGTAVALPWLEATGRGAQPAPGPSSRHPQRLAFVYVPNGANMADWTPATSGTGFELPYILEPLAPVRDRVQVLSGLAQRNADPNGDGPGDHARASATYLTGVQARKTAAVDVRAGISVDQIAARRFADETRLPSLELGCDRGQQAGACDSGYSCAYQFNLAWRTPTSPLPPEIDPRLVFDRLFGGGTRTQAARAHAERQGGARSVLDFVLEDARRLTRSLGATDRRKVEAYMSAVRETERRIETAARFPPLEVEEPRPSGIPASYEEHIRLHFDLLALAFESDVTRVATFLVAHDGSNRSYPSIGVGEGHHDLSHHAGDEEKKAKVARINRFHLERFAGFLQRLATTAEGEGTLLDHSMIVYGSGISDGNAHDHHDLPVLLAGGGNGTLTPGRHVRYAGDTPMANLYLALLERMDAPLESFGDSTGPLRGLVE